MYCYDFYSYNAALSYLLSVSNLTIYIIIDHQLITTKLGKEIEHAMKYNMKNGVVVVLHKETRFYHHNTNLHQCPTYEELVHDSEKCKTWYLT